MMRRSGSVGAVAVIHEQDEIGKIGAGLGGVAVGDLEAEVVVFGVGEDFGVDSTTRQNSASQSLSVMTQFTWFFGGGPLVSHRLRRGRC
jgi:hypothetical protein